jgi:acyl carrier protein
MESFEIQKLITECLHNLNEELEKDARFEITEGMTLFGSGSPLDSMALVTLIMDVETAVLDASGIDISLVTQEAMSRTRSPFRTPEILAEYIGEILVTSNA